MPQAFGCCRSWRDRAASHSETTSDLADIADLAGEFQLQKCHVASGAFGCITVSSLDDTVDRLHGVREGKLDETFGDSVRNSGFDARFRIVGKCAGPEWSG